MLRKRRIVVLAHCLLNVNAKVSGLALYEGVHKEIVYPYIEAGVGIIQLPCPETTFIGLQRWGMSKNQYDHVNYRNHCGKILTPIVEQLQEYHRNGYEIEAIVGVDGSPSCGVNFHSAGYTGGMINEAPKQKKLLHENSGRGVFMEKLLILLENMKLQIPFKAINEKEPL